jgi:hypothetical protein
MKDFELKVGDLVKIRDDLEYGHEYNNYYFHENMYFIDFKQVEDTFFDGNVIALYSNRDNRAYYYTKEMIAEVKRPTKYETIYKRKEPILDEKEKKYLSAVIKPFRNGVQYIVKEKFHLIEFIAIYFKNDNAIFLPDFETNTMYKNMEANKRYTLEELGL